MNAYDEPTTLIFRKALEKLFADEPLRAPLGVVLGVFIDCLKNVFTPVLTTVRFINIAKVSFYHALSAGILLVFLPNIFSYLFKKTGNRLPENKILNDEILLIENSGLDKLEKRIAYRKLIEKTLEQVAISAELKKEIKKETSGEA